MHRLSPLPRPLPMLALALAVLAAHGLLLAWLVLTPSAPRLLPRPQVQWVQLEPLQPEPAPPQPAMPVPSRPVPTTATRQRLAAPGAAVLPSRPRQRTAVHPSPGESGQHAAPPPQAATPRPAPRAAANPAPSRPHAPEAPAAAAPPPTGQAAAAPAEPVSQQPAPSVSSRQGAGPASTGSAAQAAAPTVETAPSYTADYLDNPPPPYPRLSRQLGEEGTALLKVEVGPDGRALQVRLLSSTGYSRLDEAAITTVERWRFVAATRNGQAVASWVLVPIKFRIIN